jgi:uncharacterized protein (TIGR00290 family)
MQKAFMNWSGGKDCTLALHKTISQKQFSVDFLFTTVSRSFQRVSMHGLRKELITRQALSIGIPSRKLYLPESSNTGIYDKLMDAEMQLMKERGIHHSIFGDIFLEDLKAYREEKLKAANISGHFPLWKRDTKEVLNEFISLGYKTIIVSLDKQKLDESFLGRELNSEFLNALPENVDPCGENGEFHTFTYAGPIFKQPVNFTKGEIVKKEYSHEGKVFEYAFLDLLPL